jgi:hypothetical protein
LAFGKKSSIPISRMTSTFLIPPTEKYDSLQQISSRQIQYTNDINGPTKIDVCFTLPPYLLPSYWSKNNLSHSDVKRHAEFFPTRFFWLVALLFGIDVIASAIKPSCASAQDVLICCKPLALQKIIATTHTTFAPNSNIMTQTQTQHQPAPPICIVSNETMKYLSSMVYHELKPFEINVVGSLFTFQEEHNDNKKRKRDENQYLAITMERDGILLKRCVKEEDYLLSGKQKKGYATRPIWIQVQSQIYALVEDCIMVKS